MTIRALRPRKVTADYHLLWTFLGALPPNGRWNADWRHRFLNAFTASLDYCVRLDENAVQWPGLRTESSMDMDIAQLRWWEAA